MNHFILTPLLIPALAASICTASNQAPESIRDLETVYHRLCTKRGEALLPAFSKKLLALQQQAVNKSDFETAKQIQSLLTDIKKDILTPPSSNSIDPFFTGKAWEKNEDKNKHTLYLDSFLMRYAKDVKQPEFQPQNQQADPQQSSREIVVFPSPPSRIWLKKDDSTLIQIYDDSYADWFTVQNNKPNATTSSGCGPNNLHQEFLREYSQTCKSLTQKYLDAVEKRQKQLAHEGKMEEAIAIHNYMKPFSSANRPVDQILNGIWKNQKGELYDFSNKSKVAKKSPNGSLQFYLIYTSTSPKGEWKMARGDRGPEKDMEVIIFSAKGKIYIIPNKPSIYFPILTRVSGN